MKQTAKFLVTAAVAFSTSFLGSTAFAQRGGFHGKYRANPDNCVPVRHLVLRPGLRIDLAKEEARSAMAQNRLASHVTGEMMSAGRRTQIIDEMSGRSLSHK